MRSGKVHNTGEPGDYFYGAIALTGLFTLLLIVLFVIETLREV